MQTNSTNQVPDWSDGLDQQECIKAIRIRNSLKKYYTTETTYPKQERNMEPTEIFLPRNSSAEEISKTKQIVKETNPDKEIIIKLFDENLDTQPGTPRVPDTTTIHSYTHTTEYKQMMLKIAKEAYNIDLLKELET
jgi:hypothetical protein